MKVLLILNNKVNPEGVKIIINVKSKPLKAKLLTLLHADKDREAFDLLVKQGEPELYIPCGRELLVKPAVILNEALL